MNRIEYGFGTLRDDEGKEITCIFMAFMDTIEHQYYWSESYDSIPLNWMLA